MQDTGCEPHAGVTPFAEGHPSLWGNRSCTSSSAGCFLSPYHGPTLYVPGTNGSWDRGLFPRWAPRNPGPEGGEVECELTWLNAGARAKLGEAGGVGMAGPYPAPSYVDVLLFILWGKDSWHRGLISEGRECMSSDFELEKALSCSCSLIRRGGSGCPHGCHSPASSHSSPSAWHSPWVAIPKILLVPKICPPGNGPIIHSRYRCQI